MPWILPRCMQGPSKSPSHGNIAIYIRQAGYFIELSMNAVTHDDQLLSDHSSAGS